MDQPIELSDQIGAYPWELDPEILAFKVRTFRLRADLSKQEFAKRCRIAEKTLRKIELGKKVNGLVVIRIAKTFREVFEGCGER